MNNQFIRFEAEKNLLRLKDLERIILTLFTFDYDPKECLFYSVVEDELLSPARESELEELSYKSYFICHQNAYRKIFF